MIDLQVEAAAAGVEEDVAAAGEGALQRLMCWFSAGIQQSHFELIIANGLTMTTEEDKVVQNTPRDDKQRIRNCPSGNAF